MQVDAFGASFFEIIAGEIMSGLIYDKALRFGLFLAPFHSAKLNPTYAYERDLLLTEHLDRLGFEEIWYGEHHSGAMEQVAAPELMVAAAAQRTKYIRLGTGVKSLPYYNPFILAETMAQLDHMTRGRAMFGVGPGALPSDAQMLAIEIKDLRPRMEESLDTVVALMKGETVTRKTDWFELREARLSVGCFTEPMMEIAVTTIRSPAGVVAAGRHGLGVLTLGHMNDAVLDHHVANWRIYEEECEKARTCARPRQMAHHPDDTHRRDPRKSAGRRLLGLSGIHRLHQRYRAGAAGDAARDSETRRNSRPRTRSPSSARPTTRSRRSSASGKGSADSARCWFSATTSRPGRRKCGASN